MSGTPSLSMADVRAMIRDIRREMNEKLDLIEARLRRRSPSRRAKITSRRMTPALRAEIRAMAEKHSEMAMHEIAAALKVNVGRVSEVLAGPEPARGEIQPELEVALKALMKEPTP
jgi:hypothetical protein